MLMLTEQTLTELKTINKLPKTPDNCSQTTAVIRYTPGTQQRDPTEPGLAQD